MSKLIRFLQRLWDKIRGIEYELDLPPAWPMSKCYDCGVPTPPDCWQRFVEISGKEYSVPQCDGCMSKLGGIAAKAVPIDQSKEPRRTK